jgi:agmatinase
MNFLGLDDDQAQLKKAQAVVLPAPYDATCSYKPGAVHGPAAIIEASPNAEWYDEELDVDLEKIGIATLPALPIEKTSPDEMVREVERAADKVFASGKILAGLGGEHTVSVGFVKAALRHHPDLTVLQIDAHPDLRDSYEGRKICHATVGRRVNEIAPLVQVGPRAWSREEQDFLRSEAAPHPLRLFPAARIHADGNAIRNAAARLGKKVYVTFDLDAFDPSLMPATGTPEPGGLTWRQAADLLATTAARATIVGFDVVELSPVDGLHHCDYTAARLAARLIALAVGSRR